MQKTRKTPSNFIEQLLGEPTQAKASGLTYSLTTVGVVVISFIFMCILGMAGIVVEEGKEPDWYLYCSYLMMPVVFLAVTIWVINWSKTSWRESVKGQACKAKYFLIAIVLQIGLFSLSELNGLFLQFLARFGYENKPIQLPSMDGGGFVGVLLTVALLPAVFEEIIFRGLLIKGMGSFKTVGAVLVCGGLFALYHQNPAQTLYQFCCGAAFALVVIRSGSILPTIVSHFINNALVLTLTQFGIVSFPLPVFIVIVCISAVCLIGALVWLIFFEKKTLEKKEKAEQKEFVAYAAVGIALCTLTWLVVLGSGM